jgi:hypothetical protein
MSDTLSIKSVSSGEDENIAEICKNPIITDQTASSTPEKASGIEDLENIMQQSVKRFMKNKFVRKDN